MSTHSVATIQSALFGDSKGRSFNDLEDVIGSNSVTINTAKPLKEIIVIHSGVVEGLKIKYCTGTGSNDTINKEHGTSLDAAASDTGLHKDTVTLGAKETIIAIGGTHGNTTWGIRLMQISFTIYDEGTGKFRTQGPYGNATGGQPFRVTANGNFVAFGGYAYESNSGVGKNQDNKKSSGIYGLSFFEIAYTKV